MNASLSPAEDRPLLRALRRVGGPLGVEVRPIGGGWMAELVKGDQRRLLHGYQLELNAASAASVATDKAAAYDVLTACGVPAVRHHVFLHPRLTGYAPEAGSWRSLLGLFEELGRDAVVKDNLGTAGLGVYRARSERSLEACVYRLFQRVHGIAVGPFVEIEREVRVIVLEGRPLLAIEKHRPSVEGDGVSTLRALIERGVARSTIEQIGYTDPDLIAELEEVIPTGATRLLNWRHNLGQGATARIVETENQPYTAIALASASALRIVFASVDVVQVGGQWMTLELNAGVMMDGLMRQLPNGEALADSIYTAALERAFRSPS